jgi:putative hydrolase of the HAD superfamily
MVGQTQGAEAAPGKVETLLFDFGGTLDADGIAWKERFHALYRDEGLEVPADVFQSSFFAADDALIGRLPPGTGLSGTVQALAARLEAELAQRRPGAGTAAVSRAGGDDDRGMRVASRFLSDAAATFARNRPVLEALRQRYRLGIVSNFYGNLQAVCDETGLASHFSALVDSHCVGVEKPDPAIFRAALDALRATPETTVFIGDSLRRDREGARRTGMRFIWVAPDEVAAAEAAEPAALDVDHAIAELRHLMKILT